MVIWNEQTPITGYLSRLPVKESELVQLDPGELALSSLDVRGHNSFVIRHRTEARSVWTMVPESEWVGFLIPISWSGDYVLNGWAATPNTIFQLDGAHEYHVVAERRDAVAVGIRRSILTEAVFNLSGREYAADPQMHRMIEVPDRLRQRLMSIIGRMVTGASEIDSKDQYLKIPRVLENDLISAVADWIIEADDLEAQDFHGTRSDLIIVRNAVSAIWQSRSAQLSLAEICQAAGVKKSRLYKAFEEIHGVSPGRYIYRRRLTLARECLLSEEDRPRSVKDVAIQLGFLSSGQFARAYYSLFEELPHDTLTR